MAEYDAPRYLQVAQRRARLICRPRLNRDRRTLAGLAEREKLPSATSTARLRRRHDPSPAWPGLVGRPRGAAVGSPHRGNTVVWTQSSGLQLFATEDFDTGRCGKYFAEFAHPVMGVFRAASSPIAKLIKLIEVRKLDLELQGCTACMTPRQWNQHAPVKTTVASRLKLLPDELQRLLTIGRPHIVGKPCYVHDRTFLAVTQQTHDVLVSSKAVQRPRDTIMSEKASDGPKFTVRYMLPR